MSGKVKMRCPRCGKSFKSVSAKHTLCPECEAKERVARASGRVTNLKPTVTPVRTERPTIVGPGAGILVPELASGGPPALPEHSTAAHAHDRLEHHQAKEGRHHDQYERNAIQGGYRRQPAQGVSTAPPGAGSSAAKTTREGKPPRSPSVPSDPAPTPIALTDELRQRIESRYQELAQPVEFDGIRTQIAAELGVPKPVVKRTVTELRQRLNLPSWWELQTYSGTANDLERIRVAYMPYLPVPEVGIHKRLAVELGLDAGIVYQGIHRIRAEMHLPQYNSPDVHKSQPASSAAVTGSESD
jgi:hypothetical protein